MPIETNEDLQEIQIGDIIRDEDSCGIVLDKYVKTSRNLVFFEILFDEGGFREYLTMSGITLMNGGYTWKKASFKYADAINAMLAEIYINPKEED